MTQLLSATDICFQRDDKAILQNVSLELQRGEILTLIGPNGAGKTTLVRILLGLLHADSGSVQFAPGVSVGYMPQKLFIDNTMPLSVYRFLALTGKTCRAEVVAALQRVGVNDLINTEMTRLSGGELQRVMLARAILRKPDLLVLDEPVQGVDISGQSQLYRLIGQLRTELGSAVVMVSHDLHLVMAQTDTVVCLNHHICCHGHPEHVSVDPAFLELFGRQQDTGVAVYTHHHDHQHRHGSGECLD
ncbi:zinc ABC transporter ATP-binding protein ZnuC [Halioxenophilus sp. WMMB6]|uniref:zinc ABC transporter ATP-binding protein ZnuC n=1 Tax=Halioxenophilus sp. WMMB6 TaxID=3073815 RepID=UPI00295ED4CA|nr:zinc ABC transporter ATP-binding protein ZnuC [Halioxenophilus sp. WMMB6]